MARLGMPALAEKYVGVSCPISVAAVSLGMGQEVWLVEG